MAVSIVFTAMMFWLLVLFCLCSVDCLKCRSQEGHGEQELKRVVRSCMHRVSNGNGNGNGQDDSEDNNRGYGRQVHRYDYGQEQDGRSSNGYRWQRSLKQSENRNSSEGEGGQCVAQCFFEEMNMADSNGLPDRRKVSYMLTKDLRDRELRNFFMDTVQQCFRYLENGRSSRSGGNKCAQARDLVKCMSEYAKAQCDDWEEYGSLLFN
ncbi:odorant-binding protein 59a [Drosophila subobscura]|uniref:odorant-binding protein 59a n=1 Tax=Drosophila subobscura TaxID=7241 RepID=UPI00155A59B9|nr:odorant-binding protein 59a [Drosophila subobscura]